MALRIRRSGQIKKNNSNTRAKSLGMSSVLNKRERKQLEHRGLLLLLFDSGTMGTAYTNKIFIFIRSH